MPFSYILISFDFDLFLCTFDKNQTQIRVPYTPTWALPNSTKNTCILLFFVLFSLNIPMAEIQK